MMKRVLLSTTMMLMLVGCTSMFFHPQAQQIFDPADAGIEYEVVEFVTEDGKHLQGWFLPSRLPEAEATVLFLYGNAENKSTHIASVYWLPEYGFNVLLFDYRGYGDSEGSPELAGIHRDIDAALGYLLSRDEPSARRIIVFGQSLGGALALTAVAGSRWRTHVEGVIVEGGFSSYRRIAREKLAEFWLTWPLSLTVSDHYKPDQAAGELSPIPLLLVYATDDEIVPIHHGEILYEAARSPKWLWKIDGIAHITAFLDDRRRADLANLMHAWLSRPY